MLQYTNHARCKILLSIVFSAMLSTWVVAGESHDADSKSTKEKSALYSTETLSVGVERSTETEKPNAKAGDDAGKTEKAAEQISVKVVIEKKAVKDKDKDGVKDAKPEPKYDKVNCSEPPLPGEEDAKDAVALLTYYCRAWLEGDYCRMYGALSAETRKEIPFKTFRKRYEADYETTGGIISARILEGETIQGKVVKYKVEVYFFNPRKPARTVTAALERTPDGFRVVESGIIPIDLDAL